MRSIKRYGMVLAIAALPIAAAVPAIAAQTKQPNIVQTAQSAGEFNTLVKLVGAAGLAGTLESKGPFTVFAPTDQAFTKVPPMTLAALAKAPAKLRAVLLYHVVKGRVTAARLTHMRSVKTLNGESLPVRVKNGVVTVGGATVVKANISASNGVIHVINGVLIPR